MYNTKSAWMTKALLRDYLEYLNKYFQNQGRKVAMLCDAPSIHLLGSLGMYGQLVKQDYEYLKIIYLPSNLTAVIQPADQGIIRSLKSKYRYHLLNKLSAKAEPFLNDENSNLTTFSMAKFIKFYDSITMLLDAWKDVKQSVICNAWYKSRIASYWSIPKIIDEDKLAKKKLIDSLNFNKSIFTDLDVFQSFNCFEMMGNLDNEIILENEIRNDILLEVDMDNITYNVNQEVSEVVCVPRNRVYDPYY